VIKVVLGSEEQKNPKGRLKSLTLVPSTLSALGTSSNSSLTQLNELGCLLLACSPPPVQPFELRCAVGYLFAL